MFVHECRPFFYHKYCSGDVGFIWEGVPNTNHELIGRKTVDNETHDNIQHDLLMSHKNFLVTNYYNREDPLLHLHSDRGDPVAEPADRHDGRHLRQDRRDQERVDASGDC